MEQVLTAEQKIINIGAYLRCSTEKQELILQEETVTKFVNRLREDNPNNIYNIEFFKDDGVSGKNTNRPELQRMLNAVLSKKQSSVIINTIIITKLDRLARSLQDLLEITTKLKDNNVDLIVVEQQIDTSTPQGRLMFQIIGAFAEFERSIIIERTQQGRRKALLTGSKSGKPCHRPNVNIDSDGVVYKYKEQHMSMHQIAKFYKVSITPIRRILIEKGVINNQSNFSNKSNDVTTTS